MTDPDDTLTFAEPENLTTGEKVAFTVIGLLALGILSFAVGVAVGAV